VKTPENLRQGLEFWFDFASPYSYLSVMRIEAAASQHGINLRWQPFLLGPIFEDFGWPTSPFVMQVQKGEYVWKDLQRQCLKLGLPWRRPSRFPRRAILPTRVALMASEQPWIGAFCRRIMQANFAEDREVDSAAFVAELLTELGLPAQALMTEAQSDANRRYLRAQIDLARAKGVFGAPTFFARDDMFWGNDRLDDALRACAEETR